MIVTRFIYKNMFYKVCMYVANKSRKENTLMYISKSLSSKQKNILQVPILKTKHKKVEISYCKGYYSNPVQTDK